MLPAPRAMTIARAKNERVIGHFTTAGQSQKTACRDHRRRLRRHCGRQGIATLRSRCHGHRPPQPSHLPTPVVPGGNGSARTRRCRRTDSAAVSATKNVSVLLAEVIGVDLESRSVDVKYPGAADKKITFDYLVLAAGVQSSYFSHNEFAKYAPCLKTITDAQAIRSKILSAFELAESTDDEDERRRLMTFVLVGAGPTGVELAASIAQMAKTTLRANFRRIDPATTSIVLLDGAKRVLPSFAESSSVKAAQRLAKLGVKVITSAMVEHIDDQGVTVGGKRIDSGTVLWTAGVSPSPIVKMLGAATDRAGRACVGPFLNVADSRGIFVVGDAATLIQDGRPLPGVAQVAIQQGRYVGGFIARELGGGKPPRPFRYFDKGNMAVIGKNFAILESGRIKLAGIIPWFIWAFIHIMFLPQLQNQRRVQNQWFWSYFTGQRSSRLVDEAPRI